MPRNHPLGEAIDAGRWDAEAPLGRVVLVAHAAFLDAGFVPCGKPGSHRLPRQVGLAASTLSLRYTIPELVRPRNAAVAADTAVLRLCAHGKFLILYGYLTGDGSQPSTHWACIDALFVASVLSSDLDATAHALTHDALGVRLWKALADGLCWPLFVDICHKNGTRLPPHFLSLPADLQAAILRRVTAVDLAMVECTCTALRDLVAGRELWRAKYMMERRFLVSSELSQVDGSTGTWKEMYLRARRCWAWRRPGWKPLLRPSWWFWDDLLLKRVRTRHRYRVIDLYAWLDLDRCKRQDPTEPLIRRFREMKSNVQVSDGDNHWRTSAVFGSSSSSGGAIHSPSARYRWMHR